MALSAECPQVRHKVLRGCHPVTPDSHRAQTCDFDFNAFGATRRQEYA